MSHYIRTLRVLFIVTATVALSIVAAYARLATTGQVGTLKHSGPAIPASSGNEIVVNTLLDSSTATDGLCTLREAVLAANANIASGSVSGECVAGSSSGDDTIRFSITGTINLASGLGDLFTNVNIEGPGAKLLTIRRDTGGTYRIFTIDPGVVSTISGLTVTNGSLVGNSFPGSSGGGILNQGELTISKCVVSGNHTDSAGGGITNVGTLTINNSTIANNTSTSSGGGIFNTSTIQSSTLYVNNSTISGNTSQTAGGGLYNVNVASIRNSTISTNTGSGGGGIHNVGTLALSAVTIVANIGTNSGGGILNPGIGSIAFNNTLLAGNTSPSGPDASGASFISQDYNLIGNTAGAQINGTTTHNITNVDARLGPLEDNGGSTLTHQLLDGSPAIDAGNTVFPEDQRGQSRPVDHAGVANALGGNASDIGAYEARAFEVNSLADTDDGACTLQPTGNGCTLREAINAANTTPGVDVITFAPSLTNGGPATITLPTALPVLASDMTISGPGVNMLTVQRSNAGGTPNFRIFNANSGSTVSLSDLTIANGLVTGTNARGGGVLSNGTLTMQSCNLYGNSASGGGGGIDSEGPALILKNCNIGGTAPGQGNTGGGIFHNGGSGVIPNSGSLLMTGGSISGNPNTGIGIIGAATLDGVRITDNVGGGIFISSNFPTMIRNCLIANNSNTTGFGGGGIYNGLSTTSVLNTTISGNSASGTGGGILAFNSSGLTLNNVTITNNRSSQGGGIDASGLVRLNNSIVAGNFRNAGATADDISGTVDSASSFNLVGSGGSGGLVAGVNNNQVGVVNSGLGPLSNNGGPTMTHALVPGSPAVDAASNAFVVNPPFSGPPFTDQRGPGFKRMVDGPDADTTATVDVGAYEQQVPFTGLTDTSTNEDTLLIVPFDIGDRSSIASVTATSSNGNVVPNDPAHLPVTDAGATEVITINPASDLFGTTNITVTVNLTAGGSQTRTFAVTVNSVNDEPSFAKGLDQTINEDAGAQAVSNWATELSTGPADEAGQSLTFQVTGNTNPSLFSLAPAIGPTGTLTYTSAANAFGSAVITFVLKDDGGTTNGGLDTSAPQTFTINVNPVNDAPSFSAGLTQVVNEDAGAQTVSNWATGVNAGPPNESGQTLTFQVTNNSNPGLFAAGPAISSNGTLSYTPAANANGSATVTIVLKDDGGVANGGQDTSGSQTFNISVNPVNDPPSFTKGPDQTINNNAGAQVINSWATNLSTGPANESSQTLGFLVTNNSNPGLFVTAPTISPSGTLSYEPATNAGGVAIITVVIRDNGGTLNGGQNTSAPQTFNINVDPAGGFVKFSSPTFATTESSGFATVTVQRTGNTSLPVTVDFATAGDTSLPCSTMNGAAFPRCDFTETFGTLKFAAGEDTKAFSVLITQDSYAEDPEGLTLTLSKAGGFAALGSTSTTILTINDDSSEPASNPIDEPANFVRQHYHDFLSREPDQAGWDYWTGQITQCGSDQACLRIKRIDVSNAFFYEQEYQQTGAFVYRLYRAAFGNHQPFPNPDVNPQFPGEEQKLPSYAAFTPDRARVRGGSSLAQTQLDLANLFVQRPAFLSKYPAGLNGPDFVDAVLLTIKDESGADLTAQRQLLIDLFNQGGRGSVLYRLADDNLQTNPINNRTFIDAEYNRAFVVTQYFGYLRRNPDIAGFIFWLGQVNGAPLRDVGRQHAMVCSFITSTEYQQRFSSVVSHSNTECQ